ncbi:enoyl-CoA hydratase/isomerase family protein [Polynucleobacter necessarius]|uniref:enoyl-CoA hydratase/isomerase family protein n=1 Tax=Polynucleobacter necessarius TaxID=576610 RepID=UPI000E0915A8|nr:enoyl-CoA hydratase/isomerase family protein [Polynucleobacter necessarius]
MTVNSTPPCLNLEIDGMIARVTFNNPAARNALTWPMYEELKQICDSLATNADVRVAIFHVAGDKAFVSGSDIQQFVDLKENEAYEVAVDHIFAPLQQLPIPTIVMIEGLAVGSGLLMATACDFRISTPDAHFGIPVAKTLGNCLSPNNLSWLAAHLGVPAVKKMLLTAELIKAPELLESGFLYQTVETTEICAATDALAKKLAVLAPITQKASKLAIACLLQNNLPDCTDLMRETYNSKDFMEGVNAFLECRSPQWLGE